MNDTLPEVERMYRDMLMSRPGRDRFRMGLELFEMARGMMLAGLREERAERRREAVFLRLYGDEFAADELAHILRRVNDLGR